MSQALANPAPQFDAAFRTRLYDLLKWRRDVRRFRRDPLPPGAIERLIGIACLSPSVGLSEPWRFVIVEDEARRAAIRACFESCNKDALSKQDGDRAALYARLKLAGLDDAPCQIAVFADRSPRKARGSAGDHARDAGLFGGDRHPHALACGARGRDGRRLGLDPRPRAHDRILDVPGNWTFIGHLCIGYPLASDDTPALRARGLGAAWPPSNAWCCTADSILDDVMPALCRAPNRAAF